MLNIKEVNASGTLKFFYISYTFFSKFYNLIDKGGIG